MRRVLVVTYYFPPAGGSGVQRMLKTVRYFRDAGYEPVVLTVEAGAYPSLDASLAADVPEGVEVIRTKAPDPFALYGRLTGRAKEDAVVVGSVESDSLVARLALWARANVFLPDARVGWVPFALRAARSRLGAAARQGEPFAAVLTSGPPHSVHLVGLGLRRTGVPWIADFRDPWTTINFYDQLPMTRLARALDRRLERKVLREAEAVLTVSPACARQIEGSGSLPGGTVRVVHNGADEADLNPEAEVRQDAFVLGHVGSMYASRNPTALWAALGRLHAEGAIPRLVVRLIGRVDPANVADARATGVAVETEPYVPHDQAVREMAEAALLLLSIEAYDGDRGVLTGKLYEYLASGRPVLGLGPLDGDAAALLAETGGGPMHARDDVDGIAAAVLRHYEAWAAGAPEAGAPWAAVAPYTRRAQTLEIGRLIGRLGRPS
ncbi:MAG: glycosyltransferase family 4 protein [Bacteroidota bacterium]